MSVLSFLRQEATVYRATQEGTGLDGMPMVSWEAVETGKPCRVMHDSGASAGGNEGGTVATPRCYFEAGSGVREQDELGITDAGGAEVRYRIEQMYGPAEGGDHYDVALLRSSKQG